MKRYFLVMNPSSESFRARYIWPSIFDGLRQRGISFDFGLTRGSGDATRLARKAAREGFQVVVAVGGDGTINEVVNGLLEPGDTHARATFGVLYAGTSPDFCRFHRIPLGVGPALDLLLSGRSKRVDICRIDHRETPDGEIFPHYFSCCANFGLGAAVARGSNSGLRKVWGDFLGTFFSVLSAIYQYKAPLFRVRLDGREVPFPGVFNIFVGKSHLVASGIKLRVKTAADDGRLYFLPIHGISKTRLFASLPRVYTGSIAEAFPPRYASEIEILDGGSATEIEYDGDPRGFLPARLKVIPGALDLIRPE